MKTLSLSLSALLLAANGVAYAASYGAIAADPPSGADPPAVGVGYGDTRAEAIRNALHHCARTDCLIQLSWQGGCHYVAAAAGRREDGEPRSAFGTGPTKSEAYKWARRYLVAAGATDNISVKQPIGGCAGE
ncbi:MAG: DUF4189 domain-containing protein [Methylovirgula sp.]